ncbi:MAG: adenosylhomocysteinase, partial [Candidatus Muirbacterium halophilum]|nr:adenosylhomocysteinase [Candidatus Muirbacterium halophilum]
FEGKKIGLCLHITPETAYLVEILVKSGADVMLTAANPISSQPDIIEYLKNKLNVKVLGFRGMSDEDYKKAVEKLIDWGPDYVLDDGADLVIAAHKKGCTSLKGATEETATGYYRLLKYEDENMLNIPVIATSFSFCHNLFDNKHGTSQSVIDGIIRATNSMLSGKTIVVIGYGQCGSTFAKKVKGLGANVVICETSPQKALEAVFEGFSVKKMNEASKIGDIFCTFSGNINVIRKEHFLNMKDNAIVCNAGHFDVEIDLKGLEEITENSERVREFVREYTLINKNRINLLTEGRIVNMTAAEGHPAAVMDISFSLQLLSLELFLQDDGTMEPGLYEVPEYIDESIANLKLMSFGVEIDDYTKEQLHYLENNEMMLV